MSEMIAIDATGSKFTQKRWNEFCAYIKSDDENVAFLLDEIEEFISFKRFKEFLMDEQIVNAIALKRDTTCSFACDSAVMMCDTNDLIWWQKQKNGEFTRMDKLFSEVILNSASKKVTKEKPAQSKPRSRIVKVAAGILEGNEIRELEEFEGTHSEAVAFTNKYYAKATLKSFFEDVIKFVFNYESDEDLVISTNWKTLEELESEGKIQCV